MTSFCWSGSGNSPQWSRSREGDRSCRRCRHHARATTSRNGAGLVKETGAGDVEIDGVKVGEAAMEPVS